MLKRLVITCLILVMGGLLLSPLSREVINNEESNHLLPLSLDGRMTTLPNKLEQQLTLISLGGLRSLVAAFLSVNAFSSFERAQWPQLEERYNQITTLAPQTPFYWDVGSWHLAYNASSSSLENLRLRETERNIRHKRYIQKGINFLKKGIQNNPNDWLLNARLGNLLSDPYRTPNFLEASHAYDQAVKLGAPDFYKRSAAYALAQIPEKEAEAYKRLKALYDESTDHHVPSIKNIIFVLQKKLAIPENERIPINVLYYSPKSAEWSLSTYLNRDEPYPKEGINEILKLLEPYKNDTSWDKVPSTLLKDLN